MEWLFHKVNLGIIRNKISEVNCGKNAKCRKYILNIKSTYNQLPTIFFPRSKTSRSGAYFVPETGRLVAKFPATMTICTPRATAFVRKTDENFTNWSKKFEPAAEGRRIFLMSNTVFPEYLAPQNGGWLTTVTRNQCCRSRTLPKTTS